MFFDILKSNLYTQLKKMLQRERQENREKQSDFANITYAKYRYWQNESSRYEKSNTTFKCPLLTGVEVTLKYGGICLGAV